MKVLPLSAAVLLACLLASPVDARVRNVTDANAPRSLASEGPVQVDWTDPAQFSDIRFSGNRWEAQRGNWVQQLAQHLEKRATAQLPAGETLQVTFTDIKRAGQFEPWRGPNLQDTRIVREIYPPQIELSFKRMDAEGNVIDQGERRLRDAGFMMGSSSVMNSDPLRFEKRMLDDWLRRELRTDAALSAR